MARTAEQGHASIARGQESESPWCLTPLATHQQPSKVATVSQIAAPQGWRGLIWVRPWPSLCWAPQQASKVATVSQIAAPQGWRGLI